MPQTVHIEKLIFGGDGLARTSEGTVFVSDVLAGEDVEIEITGKKAQTFFARPAAIRKPSAMRREVPCRYAGLCGGCNWLHIQYEEQLKYKQEIFSECFNRIGKINNLPKVEIYSGPEWKCRLRTQIAIDWNSRAMGFFKKKSNDIVRINHCMMLTDELDNLLKQQDIVVQSISRGIPQVKALAGTNNVIASYPVIPKFTSSATVITVAGKSFSVGGDNFFQSNAFLLEKLSSWVSDCLNGGNVADLFGGVGFFSILTAHRVKQATIVDNDKTLTARAMENIRQNNVTNVLTKTCSAEDFLFGHDIKAQSINTVILDPPRPGLSKMVLDGLQKLKPSSIIYVSCNPSTQARDAGILVRDCGYTITKAAIFDLYPQTHHMETALLFNKLQ